jgi:hypothetical protein
MNGTAREPRVNIMVSEQSVLSEFHHRHYTEGYRHLRNSVTLVKTALRSLLNHDFGKGEQCGERDHISRVETGDRMFEASLGYTVSFRSMWTLSQKQNEK